MAIPVVILSTIDPVLRETAVFAALTGAPGTGVLRQDIDPHAGTLHRVISDETGVAEDQAVPLEHACLGCAIREDVLPSVGRMAASGRWDRIVVALPVAAPTPPLSRPLADPRVARELDIELSCVVTVVGTDTAEQDLFGDDHLADRGLALALDDRRSLGEALAGQVRHADLILTSGSNSRGRVLADHLRAANSDRADLLTVSVADLFSPRYFHAEAEARIDPCRVRPGAAPDAEGVWTLDLSSRRPLHPGRLMDEIRGLGAGPICSRGRFFLASRPYTIGEWDGAGGQLSIGTAGQWPGRSPSTRLVFTGVEDVRDRITTAFDTVQMTEKEIAAHIRRTDVTDGFDPWLGPTRSLS